MCFVHFPFVLSAEWLEAGMLEWPGCSTEFWVGESPLLFDSPALPSSPAAVDASLRRNSQGLQFNQTQLLMLTGTRFAYRVRSNSLLEQGVV